MEKNEDKWKDVCIRKRIGERLCELRNKRGFTQIQVAETTGLTVSNITRIEEGKYDVRLDVLQAIAEALGCYVDIVESD